MVGCGGLSFVGDADPLGLPIGGFWVGAIGGGREMEEVTVVVALRLDSGVKDPG